jgi:hypothetical protein
MVIDLDEALDIQGPLLASGKATDEGIEVARRYKQIKDLLDTLEREKDALREVILAAAEEFPGAKSFPAGDLIIRVSSTSRETIPVSQVRTQHPEIYKALVAAGLVNKSTARTLSIK